MQMGKEWRKESGTGLPTRFSKPGLSGHPSPLSLPYHVHL
jgi:hypothetical protein